MEKNKKIESGQLRRIKNYDSNKPYIQAPCDIPDTWTWCYPEWISKSIPNAITIGPFGSNLIVSDYRSSGVPLVFVKNIRLELFDEKTFKFIDEVKAAELSSHMVYPGDLLITKMGDPPGDTAIFPDSISNAVITADCIKFSIDERIALTRYIYYALRSPDMRGMILDETMGVAQKKISLDRFRQIPIPVAPLDTQIKIVNKLDELFEMTAQLELSLQNRRSTQEALAAAAVHHLDA